MREALQCSTCVLGLMLAACSSSSGASSGATADAGPMDSSTAGYSNSACGKCVAQACAMPISKCNSDPDCATYLTCLDACGVAADGNVDPTCASACPTGSSSSGTAAEKLVTDCRTTGAGTACSACGVDGGGDAGGQDAGNPIVHQMCTPMQDSTPCYVCEDDHCCQTYANCHANPDCKGMQRCLVDCHSGVADDAGSPAGGPPDGGSCDLTCGAAHPQGLVDWAPRSTCLSVFCVVPCENPPMPPLDPCLACVYQKCADPFANLNGTAQGYMFAACIVACPSGANPCTAGCMSQYPAEMGPENALIACQQTNCPMCM